MDIPRGLKPQVGGALSLRCGTQHEGLPSGPVVSVDSLNEAVLGVGVCFASTAAVTAQGSRAGVSGSDLPDCPTQRLCVPLAADTDRQTARRSDRETNGEREGGGTASDAAGKGARRRGPECGCTGRGPCPPAAGARWAVVSARPAAARPRPQYQGPGAPQPRGVPVARPWGVAVTRRVPRGQEEHETPPSSRSWGRRRAADRGRDGPPRAAPVSCAAGAPDPERRGCGDGSSPTAAPVPRGRGVHEPRARPARGPGNRLRRGRSAPRGPLRRGASGLRTAGSGWGRPRKPGRREVT